MIREILISVEPSDETYSASPPGLSINIGSVGK